MIEERNRQQQGLPNILCLNTYLFHILAIEKGPDRMHNISFYANEGNLWGYDQVLIPVLYNNHFGLYVSLKNKNPSILHIHNYLYAKKLKKDT